MFFTVGKILSHPLGTHSKTGRPKAVQLRNGKQPLPGLGTVHFRDYNSNLYRRREEGEEAANDQWRVTGQKRLPAERNDSTQREHKA